ncbi:hypothetical protein BDR26DRAFT_56134 [Obelidium mucronatum]|nr:hypothetical protein BDR26DRAFT_56134 [Obelidium mucronatum]
MILLMATASLFGAYVSSAIIDSMEIGTNLLPAELFESITEILYILFSYKRSEYILVKLYKNNFKSIKAFIFISLIVVMLVPIPGAVALIYPQAIGTRALSLASKSTVIASGAVILLFDTFFCVSFIRYLRITSLEEEGDPRFRIIGKYGVMACIFGYAAFAVYLSSIYATPKILSRMIEDCARAIFLFVLGTLIAMKVALNNRAMKDNLSRTSATKK